MYGKLSLKLRDLNEHLVCVLCGGYYIDATTIIECLHSFCRSCIVSYLATNKCCPKCEVPAHKTRPLLNIRNDKTLQDVVYKLVPSLYDDEVSRKQKFHEDKGIPMDVDQDSILKNNPKNTLVEKSDQLISVSVESDDRDVELTSETHWRREKLSFSRRYLRCLDSVTVSTLNKLIRKKLSRDDLGVITFCRGEVLPETYTLMDVAKIFSWKSDRPLPLTHMIFDKKNAKRKSTTGGIKMETDVNSGKECTDQDGLSQLDAVKCSTATINQQASNQNTDPDNKSDVAVMRSKTMRPDPMRTVDTSTPNRGPTGSSHMKFILPKPRMSGPPVSRPQTNSQNGKNMSIYSVMNVPLIEAVGEMRSKPPTTETQGNPLAKNQTGPNMAVSSQAASTMNPLTAFTPQTQQTLERSKSINSIANRLQMKQQMQNKLAASERDLNATHNSGGINASVLDHNQTKQFHPLAEPNSPRGQQLRVHEQPQKRLTPPSYKNLTNDEAHNLALECVRSKMRMPSPAGAASQVASCHNANVSPASRNATKFIQLEYSRELGNYRPANEQRRMCSPKLGPKNGVPRQEVKYRQIRPMQPLVSHPQKAPKFANLEGDMQLLSTTRQLASLRQQQKILNEIAAAVAGGANSTFPTSESIRAAVSGLSSRMTSPRLSSASPRATSKIAMHPGISFSNTRPRFSLVSPNSSSSYRGPSHSNGVIRTPNQNGTSFTELPRIASNIGYPSLNTPREGNIDIYQNTIEKAKACVREMNLKNRTSSILTQARSSAAPYAVPRGNSPRKIQPKFHQVRSPYLAPSMLHKIRAPPRTTLLHGNPPSRIVPMQNWAVAPVHPPPALKSQYSMAPPPYKPTERYRFSPPQARRSEPNIPSQPEQEQPLCLVVRK